MCKKHNLKNSSVLALPSPYTASLCKENNITQVYFFFWYCCDSETELCWENRLSSTVGQSVLATWTEVFAVQQYFLETCFFFVFLLVQLLTLKSNNQQTHVDRTPKDVALI